jgi:hypothetical protein
MVSQDRISLAPRNSCHPGTIIAHMLIRLEWNDLYQPFVMDMSAAVLVVWSLIAPRRRTAETLIGLTTLKPNRRLRCLISGLSRLSISAVLKR